MERRYRNALRRNRSAAAQIDQLQCYCTTSTCGAGMLDAGAAVLAGIGIRLDGCEIRQRHDNQQPGGNQLRNELQAGLSPGHL